jgi:hypothetical protein
MGSFILLFTTLLALTPAATGASGGIVSTMPRNVHMPESLRPVLEEVLRRSPTFRRQIAEIARARHVKISISYGDVSSWHVLRAESTIYHYEWGAMQVDTRLYTLSDAVEVIAHELEHVCEQIEGVDVRALAARRHSGVYRVGPHFETQRAVQVGRQVAREALGVSLGATLPSATN